jgi:hypothetical protein
LLRSVCALQKKTRDVLPLTAEGTTATQQLPSCDRGRSRPSRRHQSRTSLTHSTKPKHGSSTSWRCCGVRSKGPAMGSAGRRSSANSKCESARFGFFLGGGGSFALQAKQRSAGRPGARAGLAQAAAQRGGCATPPFWDCPPPGRSSSPPPRRRAQSHTLGTQGVGGSAGGQRPFGGAPPAPAAWAAGERGAAGMPLPT